ncbi:hypothetical protein EI53_00575 [Fusobacterium naviforme]|nr:hypothetical protein EI53_00575 [Fusobacterium naviforme]STO26623.1 Uncharacterised protein [Fusobacterium naviforme]
MCSFQSCVFGTECGSARAEQSKVIMGNSLAWRYFSITQDGEKVSFQHRLITEAGMRKAAMQPEP